MPPPERAGTSVDSVVAAMAPASPAPVERQHANGLGVGFWCSAAWLGLVVAAAVFAGWLPFVGDPDTPVRDVSRNSGPSLAHFLGTDGNNFDVFTRTVYGARVSLIVGIGTIVIGFVLGGGLGLVAGYFRGRVDSVLVAASNTVLAFPQLIAALAIVGFLGPSLRNLLIALSVLAVPALFRVTRAATLAVAEREFVIAARMVGASHRRILIREILPNVAPPMLSFGLLAVAVVIAGEGALAFLGLSVGAPTPSWGALIERGRDSLDTAAHISLGPASVMFVTLVALNHIGDTLSRRFDVRESSL